MIEKRSGRKGKRLERSVSQLESAVEPHFVFGGKKGSGSARRLFVPQKRLLSPIFETRAERPHAILRMVSTHA
jgi:hypothetical protein